MIYKKSEKHCFYKAWLALDKFKFEILVDLAQNGNFKGNLSDMCIRLSRSVQSKSRTKIKNAIEELKKNDFINCKVNGRTYSIELKSKENKIYIWKQAVTDIKKHQYKKYKISWQSVLKVYTWAFGNTNTTITNEMIASDLNISESTVSLAKRVLREYFNVLHTIPDRTVDFYGNYITFGHELCINAWWTSVD